MNVLDVGGKLRLNEIGASHQNMRIGRAQNQTLEKAIPERVVSGQPELAFRRKYEHAIETTRLHSCLGFGSATSEFSLGKMQHGRASLSECCGCNQPSIVGKAFMASPPV